MGLTLYAAQGGTVAEYAEQTETLQYTTTVPGGFGALTARIQINEKQARLPHPELATLSGKTHVMDGLNCVYSGEVAESAITLDARGAGLEITAHGPAAALADDPQDAAYSAMPAQAILADQFARRAAYLPLDNDFSAVLPNQPTATFSPVFDGRTIEDILHELNDLLGDYVWGVWDHPTHKDALGFPTWRLVWGPRDQNTTQYTALTSDIISYRVAPSATRAFNGVTLRYEDPIAGPGTATVYDNRLNGDLSQGKAPFRFRRFRRDMGSRVLTSAQAAALAGQYLAMFQNISNVIEIELAALRSASGQRIPLWQARAGGNICLPELLPHSRNFQIPPTAIPGENLFFIRQTTYRERQNAAPSLLLRLDQTADFAAADLTRLRYEEQLRQRSQRRGSAALPTGMPLKGFWSARWAAASPGDVFGGPILFPVILAAAPAEVTFTALSASNTSGSPTVGALTQWGCEAVVTATGNGPGFWQGTYQTTG